MLNIVATIILIVKGITPTLIINSLHKFTQHKKKDAHGVRPFWQNIMPQCMLLRLQLMLLWQCLPTLAIGVIGVGYYNE